MIYTVTLNPAVDREVSVPAIEFDSVLRAEAQRVDIGGKGFNVSRMILRLGGESTALGFVGGGSGRTLCEGLESEGIATDFVWVAEETRTNFSVVTTSSERHLKINEAGPVVTQEEQDSLAERILRVVGDGDWCVMSGSLPPGVPAAFYADLIEQLNQSRTKTILDASGEALRSGCEAKPFLITPNLAEVTEITGEQDVEMAARALRDMGAQHVIVTLGDEGAVLLVEEGLKRVVPPAIEQRNAIGAGDALVGGVVFGLQTGLTLHESLRWGVACGTVAASLEGTAFGDRSTVEAMLERL